MKSCVEIETKIKKSLIIRRCSWFFIFRRKFRRRFFSLTRNSSKFENSSCVVDFFAMMTTNSILKIEVRIENEFATISTAKTFDDSASEEINVVNKRIRITSRNDSVSNRINWFDFVFRFEIKPNRNSRNRTIEISVRFGLNRFEPGWNRRKKSTKSSWSDLLDA